MFTNTWQRPLILAAVSLAFVTGTACAAQASPSHTPAGVSSSVLADQSGHCTAGGAGGEGGEGGKGGAGGRGGEPGQPGEPGKPGGVGCFRFDDLPDKPKAELTVVDKVHIVMALLADDSDKTKDKLVKKYKISQDQIDTWKKYYLERNWFALMEGSYPLNP
ncbi:hypothetical protein OOK31_02845 [Streptomyces sp. NBC_00249]|uniref:hypothetical protein n=1 Tax=Streptomyces sp. NBC_00249 TaxID=2975690 RepID=UPI00225AAD25|nr:hypothetical protein [Streptomyces sp. NBC_00249]MCX5192840.1 hypothetical protein [Streptomyces sp. NBC_00249]